MMKITKPGFQRRAQCFLTGCLIAWAVCELESRSQIVVLTLNEPYEQVRKQSRSSLPAADAHNAILLPVTRPTQFRLADSQYGFSTPRGRWLSIFPQYGRVRSVNWIPQVGGMALDETIAFVMKLQDELRRKGWLQILSASDPPVVDSPEVRELIRRDQWHTTYWQAGERYQVSIQVNRFFRNADGAERRYEVHLSLNKPFMKDKTLHEGAISPVAPHPGMVTVKYWSGDTEKTYATDFPDSFLFQSFDWNGLSLERKFADWCVPVMEIEITSLDKDGNRVDPSRASSLTTSLYGPGHRFLRYSRPIPQMESSTWPVIDEDAIRELLLPPEEVLQSDPASSASVLSD
ncbi:hypothetical protein [Cupriavidus campinensis]